MSKITYLQTAAYDYKERELLLQELWWKIEDSPYLHAITRYLLRFKSIADCKRFLKVYCSRKRVVGVDSPVVKKSPWPDVRYCALNVMDIYLTEKDGSWNECSVSGSENGDSSNSVPNIVQTMPNIDSSAVEADRLIVIPSISELYDLNKKVYHALAELYSHFGWSVAGDVFVPSAGMKHEMNICRRVNELITKSIASSGRLNLFEDDFRHSGVEEEDGNGGSGVDICPFLKGERCLQVERLKCDGTFYELCSRFLKREGRDEGTNTTNSVDFVTSDGVNSRDQHAS